MDIIGMMKNVMGTGNEELKGNLRHLLRFYTPASLNEIFGALAWDRDHGKNFEDRLIESAKLFLKRKPLEDITDALIDLNSHAYHSDFMSLHGDFLSKISKGFSLRDKMMEDPMLNVCLLDMEDAKTVIDVDNVLLECDNEIYPSILGITTIHSVFELVDILRVATFEDCEIDHLFECVNMTAIIDEINRLSVSDAKDIYNKLVESLTELEEDERNTVDAVLAKIVDIINTLAPDVPEYVYATFSKIDGVIYDDCRNKYDIGKRYRIKNKLGEECGIDAYVLPEEVDFDDIDIYTEVFKLKVYDGKRAPIIDEEDEPSYIIHDFEIVDQCCLPNFISRHTDVGGNIVIEDESDGTELLYDANNNCISLHDNGNSDVSIYDASGKEIRRHYSSGNVVYYNYTSTINSISEIDDIREYIQTNSEDSDELIFKYNQLGEFVEVYEDKYILINILVK